MKRKKEIQEELEKLAPQLSKLEVREEFDIPENYFSKFPEELMENLYFSEMKPVESVVQEEQREYWLDSFINKLAVFFQPKLAIGLAASLVLVASIYFSKQNDNLANVSFAQLSEEEISEYVEANLDEFDYETLYDLMDEEEQASIGSLDFGAEGIEEYLEENMDEMNWEDLEELL